MLSSILAYSIDQEDLLLVVLVAGSGQVDRDENHKVLKINLLPSIASHFQFPLVITLLQISNCWVENEIRPFTLERRSWLLVGNEISASRAALLYSLIQPAN